MDSKSKVDRVSEFFESRGFSFATNISFNELLDSVVIDIPALRIGRVVDKEHTSRRQLAILEGIARRDLGFIVKFLIVSSDRDDLEGGLRLFLRKRFSGLSLDCFVALVGESLVHVWIESEEPIGDVAVIRRAVENFLDALGFTLQRVTLIGSESSVPTKAALLRAVKVISPVTVDEVSLYLTKLGFSIPDGRWLINKLDLLRREGHLSWRRDSSYVLTELGLEAVPVMTGRRSSDIERSLVLGRRKWNN